MNNQRSDLPKVVFHLGPPRTGTTWLRRQVFSRVPEVNYLGKLAQIESLREVEISLIKGGDELYLQKMPILKESLVNFDWSYKKVNVISNEGLLFPGQFLKNDVARTVTRFAELLGAVRGHLDVSILLCERSINDHLASQWSHFYMIYGLLDYSFCNKSRFDEETLSKSYWGSMILKSVKTDWVRALFEKHKVNTILTSFEDFENGPQQYGCDVLRSIGVALTDADNFEFSEKPVNASVINVGTRGHVSWLQTFKTVGAYVRQQPDKVGGFLRGIRVIAVWACQKFTL